MELHIIPRSSGLKDKARRLGRGNATKGNYSGKGLKGQKARAGKGSKIPAYYEGGQTPLYMRLPKKKGFKRYYKLTNHTQIVGIGTLDKNFESGAEITKQSLYDKNLIDTTEYGVKIVNNGSTSKTFVFGDDVLVTKTIAAYKA
ncbi:MAG TPA: 50S ribosomal protein L15 [Candidatus Absconditabacterales bacterium]|nr:50S ribosomal protein L15 [Candidatus Absconditabacterales bacterium]HNG96886.1 50S ribosomal protein L15 [Candidatus Absconditabacterales bacterium]